MKLQDEKPAEVKNEKPSKRQYESPRLLLYGNISEITRNVTDTMTVMDNPSMKT